MKLNETRKEWVSIHLALHDPLMSQVTIGETVLPITIAPNGCRKCDYIDPIDGKLTFMEQNKRKDSSWAVRARSGEKISWILPAGRARWIVIES